MNSSIKASDFPLVELRSPYYNYSIFDVSNLREYEINRVVTDHDLPYLRIEVAFSRRDYI